MKKVKLTLVGLDGNAFYLLGIFKNTAKKQGFSKKFIDEILTNATSSDYNNLLCVLSDACEDEDEDED